MVGKSKPQGESNEGWEPSDFLPMPQRTEVEIAQLSFDDLFDDSLGISDVDDRQVFEKESLVGKPFVILQWVFRQSEMYNGDYVVVAILTQDGKGVFSDGGAGIKEQLWRYQELFTQRGLWDKFREAGLKVPKGLRTSNYIYTDPDSGEKTAARTYYLDNASA